MSEAKQDLTIGALARAAGVNVETIRFYQRRGLMPEPERPWGGIRRYARQDADRLRFIKSAQRLGFALDEVIELLRLEDGSHCEEARRLAEARLADVRARLADLARMEAALAGLVDSCGGAREDGQLPLDRGIAGHLRALGLTACRVVGVYVFHPIRLPLAATPWATDMHP